MQKPKNIRLKMFFFSCDSNVIGIQNALKPV